MMSGHYSQYKNIINAILKGNKPDWVFFFRFLSSTEWTLKIRHLFKIFDLLVLFLKNLFFYSKHKKEKCTKTHKELSTPDTYLTIILDLLYIPRALSHDHKDKQAYENPLSLK